MKDWKKIIYIGSLVSLGIILLGVLIYLAISFLFQEERPPLDIPHATILNYNGEYDLINIPEQGVKFEVRSWGDINKSHNGFLIDWERYALNLNVIPFSTISINTDDSLKKYVGENLEYKQLDGITLNGEYNEAYAKKRWDVFIDKKGRLIRVLSSTSFTDNDTPVSDIEILSWDKEEIYEIFIDYFIDIEEKKLQEKFTLSKDDLKAWLSYKKYFEKNISDWFDLDIIWFGGVFNKPKSEVLNGKILKKTNDNFFAKYNTELTKDELALYKEEILKERNNYFNGIDFKRIIIKDQSIYYFTYASKWQNFELRNIFENEYDDFFFKSEVIFLPTVKKYKKGQIKITKNNKSNRNETVWDVYEKNVVKYITDSLAITNRTITKVDLVKSDDVNLWGFEWKWNIFKFTTANNDDFVYIEYILFNEKDYYTIGFTYSDSEKELLPYFNQLVESINKIQ